MNTSHLPDHTPIIVGAGQFLDQPQNLLSPMTIAATAAQRALGDAGLPATDLDSIAVIRLFSDSGRAWASPFGGSNNPPASVAERLGANPRQRIYSEASGTQPVQLLVEACLQIARGELSSALIVGAEAIGSQKYGQRQQCEVDWSESHDRPMDDRGYGKQIISQEELSNGLRLPMYYYALIENYRAWQQGLDLEQQATAMGELLAPFSEVACGNPYAQFQRAYSAAELADHSAENFRLATPYGKLLVSQDSVSMGAALVVTNIGHARALGIDESKWVFLHGFAEGYDHFLFQRPDPGTSPVMDAVFNDCLAMADCSVDDISVFDIYSCFPCAVAAAQDSLHIDTTKHSLTVTGGLPFFGGPGSNYSLHGLAEIVARLRLQPQARGLLTANGGMLSKHAATVLSCQPRSLDWETLEQTEITPDRFPSRTAASAPTSGKILSYTVVYKRNIAQQCFVLAETDAGERFIATNSDADTIADIEQQPPFQRAINVQSNGDTHQFSFAG
jgi:acetyl-CoA C-acetyltransferase